MKAVPFPQANKVLKAPPSPRAEIQALIDKLAAEGVDVTEQRAKLDATMPEEQEIYDLWVWYGLAHGAYRCISCWEPSPDERALIAAGGPVWLWVVGHTHPPLVLDAAHPFEEPTQRDTQASAAAWAWGRELARAFEANGSRMDEAWLTPWFATAIQALSQVAHGTAAPDPRPTVAGSFRELLDRVTLTPEEEQFVRRARKTAAWEAAQGGPGGQVELLLNIIDRLTGKATEENA